MKLKELRTKRNLTQQQVADHIGCSAVVYSRYENGVRQPSIEVLLRLADLFGVSVDALLGRPEERNDTLTDYEMDLFCLLYTSPSPRDVEESRMPSSA